MVLHALEAAEELERDGIRADVLDLRTLWPMDWEAIAESVSRTNRVVVAHEACVTGGLGQRWLPVFRRNSLIGWMRRSSG